jgi:predicted AlkP superfamily pyrophosphatase or phosphodiesterase
MAPNPDPTTVGPRTRHVLVVGIDGVRLDVLDRLATPRLDEVREAGFLAPVQIDEDTPTMSGPCWATIATGVRIGKHGVWANDLSGNRLVAFPDFATRLARGFGRRTLVAAAWDPLVLARDGGPLFAAPSRLVYVAAEAHTAEAWEIADEAVTVGAETMLRRDPIDAAFVYLGAADETAHLHGCGARYEASVENADARLGRLLDAVRSRPGYASEDWTVLVVTDHGHVDEGGHGGRSEVERTAWIACCGPDVEPGAAVAGDDRPVRHVDVVPTVFYALGLEPDRHWTLDGAHLATRRPGTPAGAAVPAQLAHTLG